MLFVVRHSTAPLYWKSGAASDLLWNRSVSLVGLHHDFREHSFAGLGLGAVQAVGVTLAGPAAQAQIGRPISNGRVAVVLPAAAWVADICCS